MMKWAILSLAASLVAAIVGFGGVTEGAEIAQLLFMICIAAFVILLVTNADGGRTREIKDESAPAPRPRRPGAG